ncbi:MAG: Flp pilus assembly protein CpaB [Kiritimatiellia bacterium]
MKQKIVLVVAIVFGLLAAVLTRAYLSAKQDEFLSLKERFRKTHRTMEALCYKKDVPGGTVIAKSDLGLKTVPASGLRGQALTLDNLSEIVGRKLLTGHRTGELVFWSDIEGGNPIGGGLADAIHKKMRAVSINASGAAAVSGMVKPNDHVDVIGTFSFPKTGADGKPLQELVTCTILQNVLVLATGKDTAKSVTPSFAGSSYSTVTLEVSPREAEMLVFAEQIKGRLSLALRNRNDTSYETKLPQVDFAKIRGEIEELNVKRQAQMGGGN